MPCADLGDVSGSWFLLPVLPAICCVWLESHPNLRVGVRTAAGIARLKTEAESACSILTACGQHLSPPLFVRPLLQTGTDLGVHQTGPADRERLDTTSEPPLRSIDDRARSDARNAICSTSDNAFFALGFVNVVNSQIHTGRLIASCTQDAVIRQQHVFPCHLHRRIYSASLVFYPVRCMRLF